MFKCYATDAVRMNAPTASSTNRMVQDKIKSWLRQSRDRDGGRKRRYVASAARQNNHTSSTKNIVDMITDNEEDSELSS